MKVNITVEIPDGDECKQCLLKQKNIYTGKWLCVVFKQTLEYIPQMSLNVKSIIYKCEQCLALQPVDK